MQKKIALLLFVICFLVNPIFAQSSNQVSLNNPEVSHGDLVEVSVSASETIAEKGYEVVFRKNGEDIKTLKGSNAEQSFEVNTSDLGYGNYAVNLKTSSGVLSELYGALTGSGDNYLDTAEFRIKHDDEWQSYCQQQNFEIDSIEGKVNCLDQSIIPDCFEGETASHCSSTADSLCQDLLGYGYDSAEQICVPQDQLDDGESDDGDDENEDDSEDVPGEYMDDLANQDVGDIPEGWTSRWDNDGRQFIVKEEDNENVIAFNGDSTGRHGLSWDKPGELENAEIQATVKIDNFSEYESYARLNLRSSSNNGNEEGYMAEVRTDSFGIAKYEDGQFTNMVSEGNPESGTWYNMKLQADGDQIRMKYWAEEDQEPRDWQMTVQDDSSSVGWAGISSWPPDNQYWKDITVRKLHSSEESLAGYWSFDQSSVKDLSGNNNDAANNGAILGVEGVSGTAARFAGGDNYMRVDDSESLQFNNEFSVSTWIKKEGEPGNGWGHIVSKSGATGNGDADWALLEDDSGNIRFRANTGDNFNDVEAVGSTLPSDEWVRVTGVWTGSELRLYENGELTGTKELTGELKSSGGPLSIGGHPEGGSRYFTGSVDEVKLYSRVLTNSEIGYNPDERQGDGTEDSQYEDGEPGNSPETVSRDEILDQPYDPLEVDNNAERPVDLPDCDANDARIVDPSQADNLESILEDEDYRVFCMKPGDYRDSGKFTIHSVSGSEDNPRWIRYYNPEVLDSRHPWDMANPDTEGSDERVMMEGITFRDSNHWAFDRLRFDSKVQSYGGENFLFNRLMFYKSDATVQIKLYDTVDSHLQNSVLGKTASQPSCGSSDDSNGITVRMGSSYTTIVNNEFFDYWCGDGVQYSAPGVKTKGGVIQDNDFYLTEEFVSSGNSVENAIDLKSGPADPDTASVEGVPKEDWTIVENNRVWGEGNNIIYHWQSASGIITRNNIVTGTDGFAHSVVKKDETNSNHFWYDNIFYDTNGGMKPRHIHDSVYARNIFVNVEGDDPTWAWWADPENNLVAQNVFVNSDVGSSGDNNDVRDNAFYNSEPFDGGDPAFNENNADAANHDDLVVDVKPITGPETITLENVKVTENSPHSDWFKN